VGSRFEPLEECEGVGVGRDLARRWSFAWATGMFLPGPFTSRYWNATAAARPFGSLLSESFYWFLWRHERHGVEG